MASSSGDPGELPRHLLHLSTLQLVTRASPFTHARTLPLHTLSHLIQEYIGLLATAAKEAAELAGRDNVSVWDVGAALEEFGAGTLSELKDEVERGDEGVGEEAQRIRDLAQGLNDVLHIRPPPTPVAQLYYDALVPSEIIAINDLPDLAPAAASPAGSDDTDGDEQSEPRSPHPPATLDEMLLIKQEDSSSNLFLDAWDRDMDVDAPRKPLQDEQEDDEAPSSLWRDPSLIPSYVPDFLPPFPGMEREVDVASPVRRRREREREREAAQAEAWAAGAQRVSSAAMGGDPWLAPIPYASSMLAEMHPITALPPLSPPPASPPPDSPSAEHDDSAHARPHRRRARSLSPPPTSTNSLEAYRNTAPEIPHLATWLRPNPKRRVAASSISLSSDLSLSSSDSLFGLLTVPNTRQASRPPGFLPDYAPHRIHPFNTSLPYTISSPVPYNAASGHLLAPPPHPRVPNALPRIKDTLSQPTSPHLSLFSRLTRMGPPGPLGPKGEALEYEYVGTTATLALNVEWPVRAHNAKLPPPRHVGEDGAAGDAAGGGGPSSAPTPQTGIRLKLGRGGSQSAAGSPAPTPGPSGSGIFGGAGSGATPFEGREREGSAISFAGPFGAGASPSREMEVVREEEGAAPNGFTNGHSYDEPMRGVEEVGAVASTSTANIFEQQPPAVPPKFDFGGTSFNFVPQPSPPPPPPPPAQPSAPAPAHTAFSFNPFEAPPPAPEPLTAPASGAPEDEPEPDPNEYYDPNIAPDSMFDDPAPPPGAEADVEEAHLSAQPNSDIVQSLDPSFAHPPVPAPNHHLSAAPSPLPPHVLAEQDPIASQLSQMFSPEQILTPRGSPEPGGPVAGFDFAAFGLPTPGQGSGSGSGSG